MLMSVIEECRTILCYPELAGKRVLITGLSSSCGVDIVRAFAEHKCRIVLQFDETSEQTQTIAEIAAPHALEIKAFGPVGPTADDAVLFARAAAQAFGGLDAVINLIPIAGEELANKTSFSEVEDLLAQKLELPLVISRVAANRMKLLLTDGLLLNVVTMPAPHNSAEAAL